MGINGLLQALKPIAKQVHVSKYNGQRVAVDGYSWLHKGAYCCARELCEGLWTDKYVVYFMSRVQMLRAHSVEPVIVFDGGRLPIKGDEEHARHRSRAEAREKAAAHLAAGNVAAAVECYQRSVDITPSMAKHVIEELKAAGVNFLVAPYEADAQMAYLARTGQVQLVVTEDSDLLAYGCPRVLYKLDRTGSGEEFSLTDLPHCPGLPLSGWTSDQFLQLCVMAGCDFLAQLPGIGLKKAHGMLRKYRSFTKVVKMLRFNGTKVPPEYEAKFQLALWAFRHARVYCPAQKGLLHLAPLPGGGIGAADVDVPAALVLLEQQQQEQRLDFLGPLLDSDVACGIAEGQLDPMTHQPYDLAAIFAECRNPPAHIAAQLAALQPQSAQLGAQDLLASCQGAGSGGPAAAAASGRPRVGLSKRHASQGSNSGRRRSTAGSGSSNQPASAPAHAQGGTNSGRRRSLGIAKYFQPPAKAATAATATAVEAIVPAGGAAAANNAAASAQNLQQSISQAISALGQHQQQRRQQEQADKQQLLMQLQQHHQQQDQPETEVHRSAAGCTTDEAATSAGELPAPDDFAAGWPPAKRCCLGLGQRADVGGAAAKEGSGAVGALDDTRNSLKAAQLSSQDDMHNSLGFSGGLPLSGGSMGAPAGLDSGSQLPPTSSSDVLRGLDSQRGSLEPSLEPSLPLSSSGGGGCSSGGGGNGYGSQPDGLYRGGRGAAVSALAALFGHPAAANGSGRMTSSHFFPQLQQQQGLPSDFSDPGSSSLDPLMSSAGASSEPGVTGIDSQGSLGGLLSGPAGNSSSGLLGLDADSGASLGLDSSLGACSSSSLGLGGLENADTAGCEVGAAAAAAGAFGGLGQVHKTPDVQQASAAFGGFKHLQQTLRSALTQQSALPAASRGRRRHSRFKEQLLQDSANCSDLLPDIDIQDVQEDGQEQLEKPPSLLRQQHPRQQQLEEQWQQLEVGTTGAGAETGDMFDDFRVREAPATCHAAAQDAAPADALQDSDAPSNPSTSSVSGNSGNDENADAAADAGEAHLGITHIKGFARLAHKVVKQVAKQQQQQQLAPLAPRPSLLNVQSQALGGSQQQQQQQLSQQPPHAAPAMGATVGKLRVGLSKSSSKASTGGSNSRGRQKGANSSEHHTFAGKLAGLRYDPSMFVSLEPMDADGSATAVAAGDGNSDGITDIGDCQQAAEEPAMFRRSAAAARKPFKAPWLAAATGSSGVGLGGADSSDKGTASKPRDRGHPRSSFGAFSGFACGDDAAVAMPGVDAGNKGWGSKLGTKFVLR